MTVSSVYTPGASAEDITIEKDGGILKEILVEGSGSDTPWAGDKVFVHYVGTLTDGSKFDSSRDRGDKFSFNLGKSEVIKGWDQGVATMKIGEKAMFTIKADYGYGSAGSPPKIPGDDVWSCKGWSLKFRNFVFGNNYLKSSPNSKSKVRFEICSF